MTSTLYAFTTKKLGIEPASVIDYREILKDWSKTGRIIIMDYVYETDSLGKLHLHGMVYVEDNFYRKKMCPKGFHMKMEEIYNIEGWSHYLRKGPANPLDYGVTTL